MTDDEMHAVSAIAEKANFDKSTKDALRSCGTHRPYRHGHFAVAGMKALRGVNFLRRP